MSEEEKIKKILEEVARAVTPSLEEREYLDSVLGKVVGTLEGLREEYSVDYEVEIVGSYAKDTWLSGEADIDIFLLFPPEIPEEELGGLGLRIAREAVARLGGTCLEKYAAHPYVEARVEGVVMDIVPAYRVRAASEIISPVDRTPFHTRYVAQRLDEDLRREVRLLKKFMKGIGVYGAEIKIQGFSGYLVELLVLYYGSFLNVLRDARSWRPKRVFIDLEGYYGERERRRLLKTMPGAMVVIDPVDKSRNVASALSIQKFCEFVAAARMFLEKPNIHFFFPPPLELRDRSRVREAMEERGTDIVALVARLPPMPEDVAWGQIYRSLEGLAKLLERYEFRVYGTGAWLGSDGTLVMLFELESSKLPAVEKHCGPPVGSKNERDFLEKYLERREGTVAGPYIEGSRWYVLRRRRYSSARDVLRCEYRQAKLGRQIASCLERADVLIGSEILRRLGSSRDFLEYLYHWLERSPRWLRPYGEQDSKSL